MKIRHLALLLPLITMHPARAADAPPTPLDAPAKTLVINAPRFEADVSQSPELQPWGRAAEALCQQWYGRIVQILESDDNVRPLPPVVKIIFEKDMKGVAHVAGNTMHIAVPYVKAHYDDMGMVAHELVHLVQRYQGGNPGWLVEGMADYVRSKHFEPLIALPRINFEKAKYTDAYKTTAAFLIWIEGKYDARLIPKLHAAMRARTYKDELFKELTGKDLPALWEEFRLSIAPPN